MRKRTNDQDFALSEQGLKEQSQFEANRKRLEQQEKERKEAYDAMIAAREKGDYERAEEAHKCWQEFKKIYKEDLERATMGYDTLVTVLNKMMEGLMKLSGYIRAQFPVEWILGKAFYLVTDNVGYGIHCARHAIGNAMSDAEPAKIPDLQYFVSLRANPDNKELDNSLLVESLQHNLQRSDGEKFTPQQEKEFELAVKGWIETTQGGKFELHSSIVGKERVWKIMDTSNLDPATLKAREVTVKEFEAMRDDPEQGLAVFLQKKLNLNMEQLHEPATPRP